MLLACSMPCLVCPACPAQHLASQFFFRRRPQNWASCFITCVQQRSPCRFICQRLLRLGCSGSLATPSGAGGGRPATCLILVLHPQQMASTVHASDSLTARFTAPTHLPGRPRPAAAHVPGAAAARRRRHTRPAVCLASRALVPSGASAGAAGRPPRGGAPAAGGGGRHRRLPQAHRRHPDVGRHRVPPRRPARRRAGACLPPVPSSCSSLLCSGLLCSALALIWSELLCSARPLHVFPAACRRLPLPPAPAALGGGADDASVLRPGGPLLCQED